MKKSKWFNKQYILLSVSILLGLIVLIVGSSYAYYIVNITGNDDNNDVAVKTSNINLDVSNVSGSLSLCKAYPISDTEGLSCTPYQFTLTNNNKTDLEYYLNLEYNIIPGDPNLNLTKADYEDTIKVAFAVCEDETCANPEYNIAYLSEILDNPDTLTAATSKYSGKLLTADKTFGQGDANKKTYSIILWIDINSSYQNATVDASITAITYTITKDLKFTVAFDLQDNDVWTDDTCKSSDGYYSDESKTKCQKQVDVKDTYGNIPELVYNNEVAIWYTDQTLSKAVTANTGYLLKKYQINYSDFTTTCTLNINSESNLIEATTKGKLSIVYQGWNEKYEGGNDISKDIVFESDTDVNTYTYYVKDARERTAQCSIMVTKIISTLKEYQEETAGFETGKGTWYCPSGWSGGGNSRKCYRTSYITEYSCPSTFNNYNNAYCYKY